MIKIRQGGADDITTLIQLGREMKEEAPTFKMMDYNETKLISLGLQVAEQGGMFLAEKNGEAIGMFVGVVVPHYFGHDLMGQDLCLFVSKKHRGGTAAYRLVKAFERWAVANGAKALRFGVSTGVEPERTLKLYEKLGYEQEGYFVNKYVSLEKETADVR